MLSYFRAGKKPDATDEFSQQAMDWGKRNENTALKQLIMDYEIYKGTKYHVLKPGICYHPVYSEKLGATPDAIITDGKEVINVEVKCPYYYAKMKTPEEIDAMDEFPVKPKWAIQALAQMESLPLEKTLFGVWTPTRLFMMEFPRRKNLFDRVWDEIQRFEDIANSGGVIKTWKKEMYLKEGLDNYLMHTIKHIRNNRDVRSDEDT